MKSICIIPARGGSKRIPSKNVRPLRGKPIIAYPIAAALASGSFDKVMVSTDDAEIAKIAMEYGAQVPFLRSPATSDDHSPTAAVVREVLADYAELGQRDFEAVCCLYPTAALVGPHKLCEGLQQLVADQSLDTTMSVQTYSHPIERAFRLRDGLLTPVDPATQQIRTQDLLPAYHDAGQFYFFRTGPFLVRGCMVGPSCAPITLAAWEAADVDHESDWQWLERLMQLDETI